MSLLNSSLLRSSHDLVTASLFSRVFLQHTSPVLIQNNAAWLRKKKAGNVIPLLHHLYWLPVSAWIQYKIDILYYKDPSMAVHKTSPTYISDCLQFYTLSRTLRSSADTLTFKLAHTRLLRQPPASQLSLVSPDPATVILCPCVFAIRQLYQPSCIACVYNNIAYLWRPIS